MYCSASNILISQDHVHNMSEHTEYVAAKLAPLLNIGLYIVQSLSHFRMGGVH